MRVDWESQGQQNGTHPPAAGKGPSDRVGGDAGPQGSIPLSPLGEEDLVFPNLLEIVLRDPGDFAAAWKEKRTAAAFSGQPVLR